MLHRTVETADAPTATEFVIGADSGNCTLPTDS